MYISPKKTHTFITNLEKTIARTENELKHRTVIKNRRNKQDNAKWRARLTKAVESAKDDTPDSSDAAPPDNTTTPNRITESLTKIRASNHAKRKT